MAHNMNLQDKALGFSRRPENRLHVIELYGSVTFYQFMQILLICRSKFKPAVEDIQCQIEGFYSSFAACQVLEDGTWELPPNSCMIGIDLEMEVQ
jgi:hypothetical protein